MSSIAYRNERAKRMLTGPERSERKAIAVCGADMKKTGRIRLLDTMTSTDLFRINSCVHFQTAQASVKHETDHIVCLIKKVIILHEEVGDNMIGITKKPPWI